MDYKQRLKLSYEYISNLITEKIEYAIVLGSGLGELASLMKVKVEIEYEKIPGFPVTTIKGHEGKLVFGTINQKNVIMMKGRFHYYEGYELEDVIYGIRIFKMLKIDKLIITNAAGGVNKSYNPGDLMIINDHISLFSPSPLRGKNDEDFGDRFFDMSNAYNKVFIEKIKSIAKNHNINIFEGVYAYTKGPMYETPSEIKALAMLGADAVGMSTVQEVICARHSNIEVLGISVITNCAAGISKTELNHSEVVENSKKASKNLIKIILDFML